MKKKKRNCALTVVSTEPHSSLNYANHSGIYAKKQTCKFQPDKKSGVKFIQF